MKYVVTAAQMQAADRYTSEITGIPSLVLMERASLAVADEICKRYTGDRAKTKVCIACGSGNNGGDGFALGRILSERGFAVHFFMVKESANSSEANVIQRDILKNLEIGICTGKPVEEYDIVVDAVFGTGLKRDITGEYYEFIKQLNHMTGYKVAVDIPSGIDSDYGTVLGIAFEADLTVTFAFHKWGHMLYPGKSYCGEVVCHDIGIGVRSLCTDEPFGRMLEPTDITDLLPKRYPDSHKGTYGKAGIIAGSDTIGGAVVLCGSAAMRTGVGYTKIVTSAGNREPLLKHSPEALIYTYNGEDAPLAELTDCKAVAIGPGIGTDKTAEALLSNAFEQYDSTLILDADAITVLAENPIVLEKCRNYAKNAALKGKSVIITPHKKEFCRFAAISMDSEPAVFHERALHIAKEYGMIVVLKDAATGIYTPDGLVYVNTTGNPGMSTAGSGDVLAGIMAGLATQMQDPVMAAVLAVYIHGACGDCAVSKGNAYSMTAMDMVESLKSVLKGDA